MNIAHLMIPIVFVLVNVAWAEPVKCVIDGKTIYTDEASRFADTRREAKTPFSPSPFLRGF